MLPNVNPYTPFTDEWMRLKEQLCTDILDDCYAILRSSLLMVNRD